MSSDVLVSFGGDTKNLRDQIKSAQQSVDENVGKMKISVDAATPAFTRLQESIDKLNESVERTANSTGTLVFYQDLAFFLSLASGAAHVLTGSLNYVYEGMKLVGHGAVATATGVESLTSQFMEYTRSQAYMAQFLPIVRVENEGLIAVLGRAVIAWDHYWRSVEIAKSQLDSVSGSTIAASGNMARFDQSMRASGMGTATNALKEYISQLTRIPSITNDAAATIAGMYGSIPGVSRPLMDTLVSITVQMSSNQDQAKALAQQLTQAFSDPASAGASFLQSQKDVTAELLSQYETARRSNDVSKMRSLLVEELIAKEKNSFAEKQRHLKEELEGYSKMNGFMQWWHSKDMEHAQSSSAAMRDQIQLLEQQSQKIKLIPQDLNQMAIAARAVVDSFSPLSTKLDTINGKLEVMRQVFGGFGGNLKGATGDAMELIRQFENFKERAYADQKTSGGFSAWRVGYGSDTTTRADGRIERVTQDTIVSREDAERDLARRVAEFQQQAAEKIGESWTGLSDRAKASITSVVYNYGANSDALDKMYTAARTGSDKLIADAIRELKANPDRRYQEAANITNSQPGGNLASGMPATRADAEAMAKLKDEAQAAEDAMRGGNAVAQAQAQILARNAAGEKDSVRDAQQLVEAWKTDLSNTHSITTQVQMQNGLRNAQVSLAEKILELERSKLGVSGADDTTAKDKLETAKKLYEIEMKAAGNDAALQNAALTKKKAAETAYEAEVTRLAQEAENSKFAILMLGIEQRRAKLREDLQSHSLSNRQKLEADLALEAEQTRIEAEHYKKLRDLEDQGTVSYQQAQNKMTLVAAESAARRQQILTQDTKKIQQEYDRAFGQIGSTLTSSIMGMIRGTTTMRQLFQNVALQIVEMFVRAGVNMVMHWAATQAQLLMATVTNQTAQTGAVTAGVAAQTAAKTSGALTGAAVEKAANMATISADAAKSGAGAYSAVAGIPIIGPILAPAAAATAYGATMAFGSFDTGSWSIPHDQLAMVHAGEMIVPSRGGVAEEFRSLMGGDGQRPGGNVTNIHIGFLDTAGAGAFVKKHAGAITKAVSAHMDRNMSSRPKY